MKRESGNATGGDGVLPETRPRIAIVATGGTICMERDAAGEGVVPRHGADDLIAAAPHLRERFDLTLREFGRFPGPHMNMRRVAGLHRVVAELLADHQGVVVTHGTDTLEESAFALDLIHHSDAPVIFAGAMRSRDEAGWDGAVNLAAACTVAACPDASGKGVLLVLNDTIHAASEVTKTYTGSLDTFVSTIGGPLGTLDLGKPGIFRSPVRRKVLADSAALENPARVDLLTAHHESDAMLVEACVGGGARGIVVQALGRGNVPPPMFHALSRAMEQGVVVVVCSRSWAGQPAPVYGYEGGGAMLAASGAVFSPRLNGPKARVALSLLLGGGAGRDGVALFFGG